MQPLKESIKASYVELADLWMESFGTPFLGWWNKFLQSEVVPWFSRFTKAPTTKEEASLATMIWFQSNQPEISAVVNARNKSIENNTIAQNRFRHSMTQEPAYNPLMGILGGDKNSDWNLLRRFGNLPAYNKATMMPEDGYEPHKAWEFYKEFANLSDKQFAKIFPESNKAIYSSAKEKQERIRKIIKLYQDTGLDRFLENQVAERTDIPLLNNMRLGVFGDYEVADVQANINKILDAGASLGSNNTNMLLEQLISWLAKIAGDTGSIDAVVKSEEFQRLANSLGGIGTAESAATLYNERQMRGIGRQ